MSMPRQLSVFGSYARGEHLVGLQFQGVLPKAVPGIACVATDFNGQVGVVIDVTPKVYEVFLFYKRRQLSRS